MRAKIVWFVGLSGAGKSTLCCALESALRRRGQRTIVLDGDLIRKGVCSDLGFSQADRTENVRRIAHIGRLLADTGTTVLIATISPLQMHRDLARSVIPDVIEVFVDAPLSVCESRDPKGLYRRARAGQLEFFTGIDSTFESPSQPDVICRTDQQCVDECLKMLLSVVCGAESGQNPDNPARRPTLAVDFDGVIAEYDGWKGPGHLGAPRSDVVRALSHLKRDGWKIIVHTTRHEMDVRPYLEQIGVAFDEINRNSDYPTCINKPVASVYWDDRALTYSGNAERDLPLIRSFETWNGRR